MLWVVYRPQASRNLRYFNVLRLVRVIWTTTRDRTPSGFGNGTLTCTHPTVVDGERRCRGPGPSSGRGASPSPSTLCSGRLSCPLGVVRLGKDVDRGG